MTVVLDMDRRCVCFLAVLGCVFLIEANASFTGGSAGSKYLSVYLTGLDDTAVASADHTTSASSAGKTPSSTSTAKPSVVTVGGKHLIFFAKHLETNVWQDKPSS